MSELATDDEVEVFGQRGHVNRIEALGLDVVRVEVQDSSGMHKPKWQGWFVPELLTKIEPPPPLPKIGEVWDHVNGQDRLFFYGIITRLECIDQDGYSSTWKEVEDKHYYSKVEASSE